MMERFRGLIKNLALTALGALAIFVQLALLATFIVQVTKPEPRPSCLAVTEKLARIENKRQMCISGQNLMISDQKVVYDSSCNTLIKGTSKEERELMLIDATCKEWE